jgi:hypothetical protein
MQTNLIDCTEEQERNKKKMKRRKEAVLNTGHFVTDQGDKTQDELKDDSDGKTIFGCIEADLNDLIAKS